MNITMGGNPLTLIGNEVKIGEKAPMFKAINKNLEEVSLEQFLGKVVVLTSFPSIDTGICAMQAAKFNNELAKYEDEVSIITISNDLHFALGRFCAANGINNAITLSDHRDLEFANSYGMLLKELRLLARAVFVIDKKGQIAYKEVAKEIKTELNYDAALEVVMKAINE